MRSVSLSCCLLAYASSFEKTRIFALGAGEPLCERRNRPLNSLKMIWNCCISVLVSRSTDVIFSGCFVLICWANLAEVRGFNTKFAAFSVGLQSFTEGLYRCCFFFLRSSKSFRAWSSSMIAFWKTLLLSLIELARLTCWWKSSWMSNNNSESGLY